MWYSVVDESQLQMAHRQPGSRFLVQGTTRRSRPEQPESRVQHVQPDVTLTASTNAGSQLSSDTRKRANSEKDALKQSVGEAFKLKKKRPASWPSTNEPQVVAIKPSKTVDEDLGRVYDSLSFPRAQLTVGNEEYNKLSYKGYPRKPVMRQSPDALLTYSHLNKSNDPFQSKLSASDHSITDMEAKREARQGNKERVPKESRENQEMDEEDETLSPLYSNVNGNMHPVLSKRPAESTSTPIYSFPDMKKKREERQMKKEQRDMETGTQTRGILLQNEQDNSSPLYSNVTEEMRELPAAGRSRNDQDTEERWKWLPNYQGSVKRVESMQQVKELPSRHETLSSSPIYSNLMEQKVSVPQGPIYSVPDMEKKRKQRQVKSEKESKKLAQQVHHQAYPMKPLPPRDRSLTSTPLYSNMESEMLTVQGLSTSMCDAPEMKKIRQERLTQIKERRQRVERNASAPSLPPIPAQVSGIAHGQTGTESMYPHVSVPSYLKRVKAIPPRSINKEAEEDHLYDCPKRTDIYKQLPFEGHYDFPTSNPQMQAFVDETVLHYDVPSSLSLIKWSGMEKGHTKTTNRSS